MSSRKQTAGKDYKEAVLKDNSFELDNSTISGSSENRPNGPLIKLLRLLNYVLYKRKGNRTEKCHHKITC